MRYLTVTYCLLFLVVHLAVGEGFYCVNACQRPLSYLKFKGTDYRHEDTTPECTNLLQIESYYVCLQEYCTESERKSGIKSSTKRCKPTTVPPFSVIKNITVERLRQVEFTDLRKKTVIGDVVRLSPTLFSLSMRTLTSNDEQKTLNKRYAHAAYAFWAIVTLVGVIVRAFSSTRTKLPLRHAFSVVHKEASLSQQIKLRIQQHVTTPALFGRDSARPIGWCTIPPRLQSLTILCFLIINVVLCCVSYDVFEGNVRRPQESVQLSRLIALRTGVFAVANMPLMWTFAMRNDVLIWLTGWSYTTFSQFHRWIARMVTLQLVVHAITYSVSRYLEGGSAKYFEGWTEGYFRWGAVGLVAACFSVAWAIYPVRRRLYEAFLVGHIVLAIVFLVASFYHVKHQGTEFNMFIWPCVAVWSFDRCMRLVRILFLNQISKKSIATYSPLSGLVRLEVPVRSMVRPQAGTYYYIYVLQGLKFWESHPFTLSSWEVSANAKGSSSKSLSFIVQPQDSFTARLRDSLIGRGNPEDGSTGSSSSHLIRLLIEGPYGQAYRLESHDSVLIIVGGSGVTVAVSHLRSLRDSIEKSPSTASARSVRRVHVVWVVRHQEQFQDLLEREVASWLDPNGLLSKIEVQADVYVTHKGEGNDAMDWTDKKSHISSPSEKIKSSSSSDASSPLETHPAMLPNVRDHENRIPSAAVRATATTMNPSTTNTTTATAVKRNEGMVDVPSTTSTMTTTSKAIDAVIGTNDEKTLHHTLKSSSTMIDNLSHYNHRPSVREIVLGNARVYGSTPGKSMALVCCGPPSMADDVRAAVVSAMKDGAVGLEFFPESFTW